MELDLTPYQNKNICVALSGGGDSVALCHYLYTHANLYNIHLSAVNCEHGIRGEESLNDSAFVKKLCRDWGIELYEFSADCKMLSKARKISLETAAREFRYSCFEELLKSGNVHLIATAHHGNDNAETVLFNIARASSLTGAGGIRDREGYIRPMRNVNKREIEDYLKENKLPYCNDSTNADERITRNAFRLTVIPAIEQIVPTAVEGINRFSMLAKEDDELLYELARALITVIDGGVKVSFSMKKPLFRRAALTALKMLGVEKDYTLTHLNTLYDLQNLNNGERLSMPENIEAIREYDGVVFYRSTGSLEPDLTEISFGVGSFCLNGKNFSVTLIQKPIKLGHGCVAFNKVPATAIFRTRREGDTFEKYGGGRKKLKDYLIDKKIPRRLRDELIVLANGNDVLAILGVEIADSVKVEKGDSVAVLRLDEGEK